MLVAAKDAGVKRFIYASSSSVYGDDTAPVKREERTGSPLSPYAASKLTQELFAHNIARVYGFSSIGLRSFNVFGQRQDPCGAYAAVIPKFATALLRHQSPVINGDGSYSRDFTYIDNVVQANLLAMTAETPEAVNQVYNIAFGERTTLNELFAYLREDLSAFDPEIAGIEAKYGPLRAGDIPHSLADIGKAKRLLGYAPAFSVRDGLKRATDWYHRNLQHAKGPRK